MKKSISWLIIIFISLALQACMTMGDNQFDSGRKYFVDGDYHKAFHYLEPPALRGNADAQYAIGYMYFYGLGTVQNKQKAFRWMQRAANQGQLQAQQALTILRGDDFSSMKAVPTFTEPGAITPSKNQIKKAPLPVVNAEPIPEQEVIPSQPQSVKPAVGTPIVSSDAYTLQLMAAQNKESLQNFINDYQLQNVSIVRTERLGRDWYVLIHGKYANRDEAHNAIRNLPTAVKDFKPWARTFASIQTNKPA